MKSRKSFLKVFIFLFATFVFFSCGQEKPKSQVVAQTQLKSNKIDQIVEASCGQCNFGLKTQKGCDLAVRIKGKSYFVDGSDIDDHGDAHDDDGFCNAISKAKVEGEIVDGRFKAKSFELIDDKNTPKQN